MRLHITYISENGERISSENVFSNYILEPNNIDTINRFIEIIYENYNNLNENEEESVSNEQYMSLTKYYKVIECPICFGFTNDNITLKCNHSYCNDCLYKWVKTENKKTCPTCRKNIF